MFRSSIFSLWTVAKLLDRQNKLLQLHTNLSYNEVRIFIYATTFSISVYRFYFIHYKLLWIERDENITRRICFIFNRIDRYIYSYYVYLYETMPKLHIAKKFLQNQLSTLLVYCMGYINVWKGGIMQLSYYNLSSRCFFFIWYELN